MSAPSSSAPSTPALFALDVAILPPPDIAAGAIDLSAALPAAHSLGLRLDDTHLPHVTLTQQFVRVDERVRALAAVHEVLVGHAPLRLRIAGGGRGSHAVWMEIEPSPALRDLHARLMAALQPFEQPGGTPAAFVDGDARPGDVQWVAQYRREASFDAFRPHITLGHATHPPAVMPTTFTAAAIAACHLGRFCTCRTVLQSWTLSSPRDVVGAARRTGRRARLNT